MIHKTFTPKIHRIIATSSYLKQDEIEIQLFKALPNLFHIIQLNTTIQYNINTTYFVLKEHLVKHAFYSLPNIYKITVKIVNTDGIFCVLHSISF